MQQKALTVSISGDQGVRGGGVKKGGGDGETMGAKRGEMGEWGEKRTWECKVNHEQDRAKQEHLLAGNRDSAIPQAD